MTTKITEHLERVGRTYYHTGGNCQTDFSKLQPVRVRRISPDMLDTKLGDCIGNAVAVAEYDTDIEIVEGWITLPASTISKTLAIFHYWNRCTVTGQYWDSTPVGKVEYWIALQPQ